MYVERVGGYLGARSPVEARRVGTMSGYRAQARGVKEERHRTWFWF